MKSFIFCAFFFLSSALHAHPSTAPACTSCAFQAESDSVVNWWCPGCGLLYTIYQKCCLNKDCPLYKQPRKK